MNRKTFLLLSRYLFLVSLLLVESAFAGSIFSRRGIGLLRYRDNVRAIGMGGVGMAMSDSISFYFLNPASLTRINLSRIQGDFRYERASVDLSRHVTGLFSDASVNSLGLAIPIKAGHVMTFGVRPYSFSDFEFAQNQTDSSYSESLRGTGGLSELYLGFAADLGAVRAGVTADFYFGRLNRIWRLNYVSGELRNSEDVRNRHFTGVGLHLGLQAQHGKWQLGTAAGLPARLNVKTELTTLGGFSGVIDKSKLRLPFWFGAGLGYAPNRHWLFGADYRTQRWSAVDPDEFFGDRGVDSHDINFGSEVIPSLDALDGYFKRISYRLGGAYRQLPYEEPAGKKVRELTVNLGLGLPFGRGYNRIDLALEIGKRGSLSSNLVKENIVMIHAAIVGSERWFQRSKRR